MTHMENHIKFLVAQLIVCFQRTLFRTIENKCPTLHVNCAMLSKGIRKLANKLKLHDNFSCQMISNNEFKIRSTNAIYSCKYFTRKIKPCRIILTNFGKLLFQPTKWYPQMFLCKFLRYLLYKILFCNCNSSLTFSACTHVSFY